MLPFGSLVAILRTTPGPLLSTQAILPCSSLCLPLSPAQAIDCQTLPQRAWNAPRHLDPGLTHFQISPKPAQNLTENPSQLLTPRTSSGPTAHQGWIWPGAGSLSQTLTNSPIPHTSHPNHLKTTCKYEEMYWERRLWVVSFSLCKELKIFIVPLTVNIF